MDFAVEKIDLTTVHFTPRLLSQVPADTARRFRVLPVSETSGTLCLALTDPQDLRLLDELHRTLQRELDVCQADQHQIDTFLRRLYGDHVG